ncbi:CsgG/HfaB family protein [Candidatus Zixiibacteriota bacterium]
MNCSAGTQGAGAPASTHRSQPNPQGQLVQTGIDTVAVMPFTNATNDAGLDWLCMGIPETITDDLLKLNGLVVVERLQLWKVMEEQALHLTGAVDDDTVVEIGKLLGADYLVVGAFQKMGATLRLTARFVEAESGSIMNSAKITGSMDDVFDLQDQIVSELAVSLRKEAARIKDVIQLVEQDPTLKAYRYFGEAMLLTAGRDYPGAVTGFQAALRLDPTFEMARDRLTEVWWPLQAGNSWEYEVSVVDQDESLTTTRQTMVATGRIEFERRLCLGLGSSSGTGPDAYYMVEDSGIALLGGQSIHEGAETQSLVFSPTRLLFPYKLRVGHYWETRSSAWLIEEEKRSEVVLYHHAVPRMETIEIPGVGGLECFLIQMDPLPPGSGGSITYWFAPGVGIVKSISDPEITERPGSGGETTRLLKSFSFSPDITIQP